MTNDLKNKIDKIWDTFFAGGVANPLSVIEQMTYLMYIKSLDDAQLDKEKTDTLLGIKSNMTFDEEHQDCRWSKFKNFNSEKMFETMQTKVFPFIKNMAKNKNSGYAKFMADAIMIIPTPLVLQDIVDQMDKLELKDTDTRGDVYEYMLSKLSTAGDLGQFRTPRHIIDMMVELTQPTPEDIICDPACGSAGFLVSTINYMHKKHSELFNSENLRAHYNNTMFYGFDMDRTMLRIGAMNMMQHGVENPNVEYKDSVSEDNEDANKYTLILANPPFKGTINKERIASNLKAITNATKTELLFLALFLRTLRVGGRCASIVPDGVLFGSSNAHKSIRREIIENNKLEAVISMPSGVFKPYAGVSTAILIFTKTTQGGTDKVWFYDMKSDGFTLDDKRSPIDNSDIPDIIKRWNDRDNEISRTRKEQSFFVDKQEIVDNDYDLSINKYKEIEYVPTTYPPTSEILKDLHKLEKNISIEMDELEKLLND